MRLGDLVHAISLVVIIHLVIMVLIITRRLTMLALTN
jgi:hypothetical protein